MHVALFDRSHHRKCHATDAAPWADSHAIGGAVEPRAEADTRRIDAVGQRCGHERSFVSPPPGGP